MSKMDEYHEDRRRLFCNMCGAAIAKTNSQGYEICGECEELQDARLKRFSFDIDGSLLPQEH